MRKKKKIGKKNERKNGWIAPKIKRKRKRQKVTEKDKRIEERVGEKKK